MEILTAEYRHLESIMEIERAAFSVPWSREGIRFELECPDAGVFVATQGDEVLGFAVLHLTKPEGELYNIAVREEHRGQGVGRALLEATLQWAWGQGAEHIYLEVRRSNAAARALYRSCGFSVCGERRNYYEYPREDAILMEAEV